MDDGEVELARQRAERCNLERQCKALSQERDELLAKRRRWWQRNIGKQRRPYQRMDLTTERKMMYHDPTSDGGASKAYDDGYAAGRASGDAEIDHLTRELSDALPTDVWDILTVAYTAITDVATALSVSEVQNRYVRRDATSEDSEEHFPWSYTEYGVLCFCGAPMDRDERCLGQGGEPR